MKYMYVNIKWIVLNIAILFSLPLFSQTVQKVTRGTINQPLRTVLNDISVKNGYNFIYSDSLVDDIKIDYSFNKEPVEDVLAELSNRFGISYKIFNKKNIVLFKKLRPRKELYKALF